MKITLLALSAFLSFNTLNATDFLNKTVGYHNDIQTVEDYRLHLEKVIAWDMASFPLIEGFENEQYIRWYISGKVEAYTDALYWSQFIRD